MRNYSHEHMCVVCGTNVRSNSSFGLIRAVQAHTRKHDIHWNEQKIKEEYINEFNQVYSNANKTRSRTPEHVENRNKNLLQKIGEAEYLKLPKCAICGMVSNQLYTHLHRVHEITPEKYSEEYGGPLSSDSYRETLKNRYIGEKNPMYGKGVSENSPFAVEFYIKKGHSPEEARILRDEKIRKIDETRTISTTVEYYENKFGVDTLTAKEMLKERQSTNRVDVIAKRHNISIEEAQELRDQITKKWVETLNKKSDEEWADINQKKVGKNISGASMKFFDELVEYCGISKEECLYGEDKEVAICRNEKFTDMQMKKYFLYDFTYKNKMIEFNGDLYHANPRTYAPDDKPFSHITAITDRGDWTSEQIWNFDTYKNKVATDHGYEMLVVWEYDAKHNLRDSLEKCKKYLLGENNVQE